MLLHEPEAQERMRRVRTLLASLGDNMPQAKAAKFDGRIDGPAASRYVPCDTCRGTMFLGDVRCGDCWRTPGERLARKGDIAWDEYVEAPLEEARKPRLSAGTLDLRADIARLTRELHKLELDALAREGIVSGEERWVVRQDQLDREGSYKELRDVLKDLERVCPRLRWVIAVVYESRVAVELPEDIEKWETLAVAWISLKMRGDIRLPNELQEEHAAGKRRTVEELLALGRTTKQIAFELGLAQGKVKRIVKARNAA